MVKAKLNYPINKILKDKEVDETVMCRKCTVQPKFSRSGWIDDDVSFGFGNLENSIPELFSIFSYFKWVPCWCFLRSLKI